MDIELCTGQGSYVRQFSRIFISQFSLDHLDDIFQRQRVICPQLRARVYAVPRSPTRQYFLHPIFDVSIVPTKSANLLLVIFNRSSTSSSFTPSPFIPAPLPLSSSLMTSYARTQEITWKLYSSEMSMMRFVHSFPTTSDGLVAGGSTEDDDEEVESVVRAARRCLE